jgi:ATP-dependent Clp protease adapter protein ClpS
MFPIIFDISRRVNLSLAPTDTAENSPIKLIELEPTSTGSGSSSYRVILYNDDWHSQDEVAVQLQKATGCDIGTAFRITLEVDANGRGVCYRGGCEACHRVTRVLREIQLQCEVDDDQ